MTLDPRLMALSSPFQDDDDALAAAKDLLAAPDPAAEVATLYAGLLHHKTLPTALAHLERAGSDLERLTIPSDLFDATWPLNGLLARPDERPPGRIPLAAIARRLDRHAALLTEAALALADAGPNGDGEPPPFVLIFGRAFDAAYPGYRRRLGHDVDVWAPDLPAGLRVAEALCGPLGLTLTRCKVAGLGPEAFGVFNTFRARDGHELHVDVMAGGQPYGPTALPLLVRAPDAGTLRPATWKGRAWTVPSAEDMLLMVAVRAQRKGEIVCRDVADARFLLRAEPGLDWDGLCAKARAHQVNGALHRLLARAASSAGDPAVPDGALRSIRPGPVERRAMVTLDRSGSAPRLWPALWGFRYLRVREGSSRAAARLAGDAVRSRLFALQVRLARRGGPAGGAASALRGLRPAFFSLCEFRIEPPASSAGFCLSRTRGGRASPPRSARGEAVALLHRIVTLLPAGAVEEGIRLRTAAEGTARPAHRCGAYVLNARPRTPAAQ